MTEGVYYTERIDAMLCDLGYLSPIAQTDDVTLASVVGRGLWAGFYLALRHPEWLAQVILEGNAALDDPEFEDWSEQKEWEGIADKLVSGERPL